MKRFVLDASVVLGWFVDRPTVPYAAHVRESLLGGGSAVVPALWQIEVANGFIVAQRRGVLTPTDTAAALQNLDGLLTQTIQNSRVPISMRHALQTGIKFGLTAYDAVYLQTALDENLPLATLDRQLKVAALKAGVELFD